VTRQSWLGYIINCSTCSQYSACVPGLLNTHVPLEPPATSVEAECIMCISVYVSYLRSEFSGCGACGPVSLRAGDGAVHQVLDQSARPQSVLGICRPRPAADHPVSSVHSSTREACHTHGDLKTRSALKRCVASNRLPHFDVK